ncbi:MAG: MGMT family protein [Candidatus Moraniibacteriota bacterium]
MKKQVMLSFAERVYRVVAKIPKGSVMTYGGVAKRAGFPGAARAVGTVMKENPDPKRVPCHRVVRSDGRVGEYAFGGKTKKIARLKAEGVSVTATGRILKRA